MRTFGAVTDGLLALADWLAGGRDPRGDGEHRGLLEAGLQPARGADFELLVVNARHIKAVPGRKTDVKRRRVDRRPAAPRPAARQLHPRPAAARAARAGPLPPHADRGARRARRKRLHKVLEGANIKLGAVASRRAGRVGPGDARRASSAGRDDPRRWPRWRRGGCATSTTGWWPPCAGLHRSSTSAGCSRPSCATSTSSTPRSASLTRRDRGADAPFRGRHRAGRLDPGRRPPDGRGHPRRDRHRHGPLPVRSAPRLLGPRLPRHRRERRQARAGRPVRATTGSGPRSSRRPTPPPAPRAPTSPPSTSGSPPGAAPSAPLSPSATPSSSSSTTCCATASPTRSTSARLVRRARPPGDGPSDGPASRGPRLSGHP